MVGRAVGWFLLMATAVAGAALAEVADQGGVVEAQEGSARSFYRVVPLTPGWNFVAWTGGEAATADALAALAGTVDAVFAWDPEAQAYRRFDPDAPAFLNTLEELRFQGVWVSVPESTTWTQPDRRGARAVDLRAGFNLEVWTGASGTPIEEALRGLEDTLGAAFTYDGESQSFRSFAFGRPGFLNTAGALGYGDALWLKMAEPATWEQAAFPVYHTNDLWFFKRIVRRDASGAESDFLADLLAQLDSSLGEEVPLPFDLQFREASTLSGAAADEAGNPLPSISLTYGRLTGGTTANDVNVPSLLQDVLFNRSDRILLGFSTARIDLAPVNFDEDDLVTVDLSGLSGVEPGDTLIIDLVTAQLLPPDDPRTEDGLSSLEVFQRRWATGAIRFGGTEDESGALLVAEVQGLAIEVVGAAPPSATVGAAQSEPTGTWAEFVAKIENAVAAGLAGGGATVFTPAAPSALEVGAGTFAVTLLGQATYNAIRTGHLAILDGGPSDGGPRPLPPPDEQPPAITFTVLEARSTPQYGHLVIAISANDSGGIKEFDPLAPVSSPPGLIGSERPSPFSWARDIVTHDYFNYTCAPLPITAIATAFDRADNIWSDRETYSVPQRVCEQEEEEGEGVIGGDANRPPVVSPIQASLSIPTTTYTVSASDPDEDELTFAWEGPNCGTTGVGVTDNIFLWSHPHPPCDPTTEHADVTITVLVDDGFLSVRCTYRGAASGVGPICETLTAILR